MCDLRVHMNTVSQFKVPSLAPPHASIAQGCLQLIQASNPNTKSLNHNSYLIDILVVDLHHGCVNACPEALDLTDREQTVLAGAVHLDMCVVLDRLHHLTSSSKHARSGPTHLQVVLAYLSAVEHSVERCHLIHLHGSHVQDLGYLVHCREGKEVLILLLSKEEHWDACRFLVVGRVLFEQLSNLLIILLGELKGCIFIIVLSVTMVHKRTKWPTGRPGAHS
jgi:hypothetical protein